MISIILSVYNVEKYIVNCLKSIVNQDYANFELVIIDDGSTDKSVEKIEEYLSDKDIKWNIYRKENGGQSSSRNFGIKKANGEYIVFLDSDDVISKNFLSSLKDLLDNNNADFSFCNYEYVKEQIPPVDSNAKIIIYEKEKLLNDFLKRTINFVLPSMMFKKQFIIDNNLVFNEDIKFSEDQMFIWDTILKSNKSIYTTRKMYGYYLREKSIMTSSPYEKIKKAFFVFKKYTDELINEHKELANITKLILPRWELGALYSAAKLVSYDEFLSLYEIMNGKTLFSRVNGINEITAIALSIAAKSPKALYELCKRMK